MVKFTEQQLDKFKEEVYEPYNNAWKIIHTLKTADLSKQKTWDDYLKACEEFKIKYPSEIGGSIYRVLIDASDSANKISKL